MDTNLKFPLNPAIRMCGSILIEAIRSNPNGDPNTGGAPRLDENDFGIISNACTKRKIRDFLARRGLALYVAAGVNLTDVREEFGNKTGPMVEKFIDLRLFGGVVPKATPKLGAGLVQFTDGRSIDPVIIENVCNTRVAFGSRDEVEVKSDADDADADDTVEVRQGGNMGNRSIVTYGLYRIDFFLSPNNVNTRSVTEEDLALFWEALVNGWEESKASYRAGVRIRRIVVFADDNQRGHVHSHVLLNRLQVQRADPDGFSPSKFEDYTVDLDTTNLPPTITVHQWADCVMLPAMTATTVNAPSNGLGQRLEAK